MSPEVARLIQVVWELAAVALLVGVILTVRKARARGKRLFRDEVNDRIDKLRDLLFRSPSGSLTHEEAASAYKALRKGLSGILADPQSDGAGALPTSPSPKVGVATSPPVPSPDIDDLAPGSLIRAKVTRWSGSAEWPPDTSNVVMRLAADGYWHATDGDPAAPFAVVPSCTGYITVTEVLRIGVGADITDAYRLAREDTAREIRARIQALRAAAITAPEQAQLDKAIKACR